MFIYIQNSVSWGLGLMGSGRCCTHRRRILGTCKLRASGHSVTHPFSYFELQNCMCDLPGRKAYPRSIVLGKPLFSAQWYVCVTRNSAHMFTPCCISNLAAFLRQKVKVTNHLHVHVCIHACKSKMAYTYPHTRVVCRAPTSSPTVGYVSITAGTNLPHRGHDRDSFLSRTYAE